MNKEKKIIVGFFSVVYLVIVGLMIAALCCGHPFYLIFLGIPALFLLPIFETFYRVPKKLMYHVFVFVLMIIGRLFLAALAMMIPALLWYFIEEIHESVNSFFLLIPFFEIIIVYAMIIVLFFLKGKQLEK